jgi:hypothetical protein
MEGRAPSVEKGPPQLDEARRLIARYCRLYYPRTLNRAKSALRRLAKELRLDEYLQAEHYPGPETLEDFIVRAMGITPFWPETLEDLWPSLAVSPDGNLIARAGVFLAGPVSHENEDGSRSRLMGVEARLDVFDLRSNKRVWSTSIPWGGGIPRDGKPFLPCRVPEFLQPHFADLRWSSDGSYLSFSAMDLPAPAGLPRGSRGERLRIEGLPEGCRTAAVIVNATGWSRKVGRGFDYLYIPDARNAFVIPARR